MLALHSQNLGTHTHDIEEYLQLHSSYHPDSPLTATLEKILNQSRSLQKQLEELATHLEIKRIATESPEGEQKVKREPWRKLSDLLHSRGKTTSTVSIRGSKRKAEIEDGRGRDYEKKLFAPMPTYNVASQDKQEKDVDSMSLSGRSLLETTINDLEVQPASENTSRQIKKSRVVADEPISIEKDDITALVEARVKARRKKDQRTKDDSAKRRRSSGNSDMLNHKRRRRLE